MRRTIGINAPLAEGSVFHFLRIKFLCVSNHQREFLIPSNDSTWWQHEPVVSTETRFELIFCCISGEEVPKKNSALGRQLESLGASERRGHSAMAPQFHTAGACAVRGGRAGVAAGRRGRRGRRPPTAEPPVGRHAVLPPGPRTRTGRWCSRGPLITILIMCFPPHQPHLSRRGPWPLRPENTGARPGLRFHGTFFRISISGPKGAPTAIRRPEGDAAQQEASEIVGVLGEILRCEDEDQAPARQGRQRPSPVEPRRRLIEK